MPNYYIGQEELGIGQSNVRLGSGFGELEMVGTLFAIKSMGIAPVWVIGSGGSVNIGFGSICNRVLYFGACDYIFYAVNAETGKEMWRFRTNDIIVSKPYVSGKAIYFGSYDENLYCLDINGKLLWKFPVNSKIACSIESAEGKIFFGTEDGKFYCLSEDGKLLWSFVTNGSIVENAAIGDNILVFGSWDKNVYALDFNGKPLWKFSTNGEINIIPAISGNTVYLGSSDKNAYALDLKRGRLLWKFGMDGACRGVTVHNDMLLYTNYVEQLYALNKEGGLLWKFKMGGYPVEPPFVFNNTIYFGSTDNNFYALDLKGNLIWKFPTQAMIVCTPIVWREKIYFGSYDCNVYCLDLNGNLLWKFHTSRSDISKIDVEEMERQKKTTFILRPQQIEVRGGEEEEIPISEYGTISTAYVKTETSYVGRKKGYMQ